MDNNASDNSTADNSAGLDLEDSTPVDPSQVGTKDILADKNEARKWRGKLAAVATFAGLEEAEIRALAAAELMLPDPFRMLLDSDPMSRVETAESRARHRVQHTDFMASPGELNELLSGSRRPVGIRSTSYLATEKSLAELMVAVRGARKIVDAFRRGYEEQHALLNELLRLVQERMMTARVQRHSVPAYLLEFARLMESIGCKRNDLRYVDGRVVRAIREALKGNRDEAEFDAEAEAARFQAWSAEGDITPRETEFERLSRSAATALMNNDMATARAVFAALEMHEATPQGGSESPAGKEPKHYETHSDGVEQRMGLGVAGAGSAEISAPESAQRSPILAGVDGDLPGNADAYSGAAIREWSAIDAGKVLGAAAGSGAPEDRAKTSSPPASPTPSDLPSRPPASSPSCAPSGLMDWAVKAPVVLAHGRVTGIGRLPGGDPFGGVRSLAKATPDCVPMWDREDRPMSASGRLTTDDWYRFEVPFGPYALVHMPKMLIDYAPVQDEMFPPFLALEQYGEAAAFAPPEMLSLKVANMGRGPIDTAIRAVRSVLIQSYGRDDEELLRFWMFLLLGRRYMDRIDGLFPNGYFQGVRAPDPAALDTGIGSFELIRILDDGRSTAQI